MSLAGLAMTYLPVGLAVVLPLSVAWYGWRGLSVASKAAGMFKMGLGVMLGVGIEALRRALGLSFVELGDLLLDVAVGAYNFATGVA